MEKIRQRFESIGGWRHPSYVEHKLADVLILVMGVVVSGITELADMMVFFVSNEETKHQR